MIIKIKGLCRRFSAQKVLSHLDFSVSKGEIVAILGENGAGKTTFLKILSTLILPSSGFVSIAGFSLTKQPESIRKIIGYVGHSTMLYNQLNAEENLRFFGNLYCIPAVAQRSQEILELFSLSKVQKVKVRNYSRGMMQRLAIGRSILHDPELLFMDEPYNGIDPAECERLDQLFINLSRRGKTIILTSHNLERAQKIGQRFAILKGGAIAGECMASGLPSGGLAEYYKVIQQGEGPKKSL